MSRLDRHKPPQLLAQIAGRCPFHRRDSVRWFGVEGLPELQEESQQRAQSNAYVVVDFYTETNTNIFGFSYCITVTKPCGHIICSPCVTKFMTPHEVPDPHASKEEQAHSAALHGRILCYVCETDLTPLPPGSEKSGDANGTPKKSKKKDKDKDAIRPGLVEISSEGTGFAGRGGNVGTKTGVAFQC